MRSSSSNGPQPGATALLLCGHSASLDPYASARQTAPLVNQADSELWSFEKEILRGLRDPAVAMIPELSDRVASLLDQNKRPGLACSTWFGATAVFLLRARC